MKRTRPEPKRRSPRNGNGASGQERLAQATLGLLRESPAAAAQRTEVARAAGVTPALVCYYYPEHNDLIEAAARPVVELYLHELEAILARDTNDDGKLRSIILLLIRAHVRDPNVVDSYIDLVRRKNDPSQMYGLLTGYQALVKFIAEGAFTLVRPALEPGFVVFALWGMCRGVTRNAALPVDMLPDRGSSPQEDELVAMVISLIGNPAQGPSALQPPLA